LKSPEYDLDYNLDPQWLQLDQAVSLRFEEVPDLPPAWTASAEPSLQQPRPVMVMLEGSSARGGSSPSENELELYRLTKSLREEGFTCPDGTEYAPNFSPYLFDCRLWSAARFWSEEMAREGFFSHNRDSSTPCTRTEDAGFPHMQGCGENIAAGRRTPEQVLQQWKESNGHCKNMLNARYNRFGPGLAENAQSTYTYYWTQAFGSDTSEAEVQCLSSTPNSAPPPAPTPKPIAPTPAPRPTPIAATPACSDAEITGFRMGGAAASCTQLVPFCQHKRFGEMIQGRCPQACSVC